MRSCSRIFTPTTFMASTICGPSRVISAVPVPLYCTHEVERKMRQSFAYAFTPGRRRQRRPAICPSSSSATSTTSPFEVLGERVVPISLIHAHFNVFGFRIGDVAYCTDVNKIPKESWPLLEDLDVLVLDALRHKPHPGHFSLDEALEVIDRLKPKQAYFTHMSHELDHAATNRSCRANVELAYDGLSFAF